MLTTPHGVTYTPAVVSGIIVCVHAVERPIVCVDAFERPIVCDEAMERRTMREFSERQGLVGAIGNALGGVLDFRLLKNALTKMKMMVKSSADVNRSTILRKAMAAIFMDVGAL